MKLARIFIGKMNLFFILLMGNLVLFANADFYIDALLPIFARFRGFASHNCGIIKRKILLKSTCPVIWQPFFMLPRSSFITIFFQALDYA